MKRIKGIKGRLNARRVLRPTHPNGGLAACPTDAQHRETRQPWLDQRPSGIGEAEGRQ